MTTLSTGKPTDRKAHFDRYVLQHLKGYEPPSAKVIRRAEEVFLKGGDEPDEDFIRELGWNWWLFLQPEQNEALWTRHFQQLLSGDDPIFSDVGSCVMRHWNINPCPAPLTDFGWSHAEDLAYYRFLLGETYDPEHYQFLGEKASYPASAIEMIQRLGWNITMAMKGNGEAIDGKSPQLYSYWRQLVLSVDPDIFEPESVYTKGAKEIDAKMTVARMILQSLRPKYCNKLFLEYGEKKRNGSVGRPVGMQAMSADEFWDHAAFVALREQLHADIDNGVFPESIQRLKHWASRPESDPDGNAGKRHTKLMRSSEERGALNKPYEDPWSIEIKPKRRVTKKKSVALLSPEEIGALKEGLEPYRLILDQNLVPGYASAFDTEEKLIVLAKGGGRMSNSRAAERIKGILKYNLDEDFDEEILYFLLGNYAVDLSDVQEEDERNDSRYLREGWKDFSRAISAHLSVLKTSSRNVKGKVRVTLEASQTHEYHYGLSDAVDKKLVLDMRDFIVKENLPWQLHAIHKEGESGTTADGNTICFYLPKGCAVWFSEESYKS